MDPKRESLLVQIVEALSDEGLYEERDLVDLIDCLRQHAADNVRLSETTGSPKALRLAFYLKTDAISQDGGEVAAFTQGKT